MPTWTLQSQMNELSDAEQAVIRRSLALQMSLKGHEDLSQTNSIEYDDAIYIPHGEVYYYVAKRLPDVHIRLYTYWLRNLIAHDLSTHCRNFSTETVSVETGSKRGWQSSFYELFDLLNKENYNPSITPPNSETYLIAKQWLEKTQATFEKILSAPEMVADAEGHIYIEWKVGETFVSVEISDNVQLNGIYVEDENDFKSFPLNEENLNTVLQGLCEKAS